MRRGRNVRTVVAVVAVAANLTATAAVRVFAETPAAVCVVVLIMAVGMAMSMAVTMGRRYARATVAMARSLCVCYRQRHQHSHNECKEVLHCIFSYWGLMPITTLGTVYINAFGSGVLYHIVASVSTLIRRYAKKKAVRLRGARLVQKMCEEACLLLFAGLLGAALLLGSDNSLEG